MNQQIRDGVAFWACIVLAHVNYFGGSKAGAAVWTAFAAALLWKARRDARTAAGRPSFWQRVWGQR